jgi:hypothetical protein
MMTIPLAPVPSQTLKVTLAQQSCRLDITYRVGSLFIDLYVSDALIVGGVICRHGLKIVRDAYLGFVGDLAFYDTQGTDDPTYDGLGSRYVLAYVETTDFAS